MCGLLAANGMMRFGRSGVIGLAYIRFRPEADGAADSGFAIIDT